MWKWLGLAVVAVVTMFFFFKAQYPSFTYRYRLTISATVNNEVRSGSSIIEVKVSKQPMLLTEVPIVQAVKGEAVFVDLGDNRDLIALLASGPLARNTDFPQQVVPQHLKLNLFNERDWAQLRNLRGRWELGAGELPTLMTFTDLTNPATGKVVQPNDFSTVFGSTVRFDRATIEIISDQGEPISHSIAEKLPWWNSQLPWIKPLSAGVAVDTRKMDDFRWTKSDLQRDF
jgi:hypothetical protein